MGTLTIKTMGKTTEFIDREAALDIVNGWRDQLIPTYGKNDEYVKCLETVAEHLESLIAADVRPVVKATWIAKEMQALFPGMDEHPVFVCSECGYQIYDLLDNVKERHHFCPNCGAKMEES